MATPTILINNSTGSDTTSSGAGPATAISGSNADTDGTTTVDLSTDSPDLSGVATDGSAALYINASSGRKFFRITGVDNGAKTVTVADAPSNTETIAWAIGGKRDSVDGETQLWNDLQPGWIVEIEYTGTDYNPGTGGWDVNSGGDANNKAIIRGTGASTPTIISNMTSSNALLDLQSSADYLEVSNLILDGDDNNCSNVVRVQSYSVIDVLLKDLVCKDCSSHGLNIGGNVGSAASGGFTIDGCEVDSAGSTGIYINAANIIVLNCYIHDCTSHGIRHLNGANRGFYYKNICYNNGDHGIVIDYASLLNIYLIGNVCSDNTSAGVSMAASTLVGVICNNILWNNGTYGMAATHASIDAEAIETTIGVCDFNAYGSNTSGDRDEIPTGDNDVTLTVSPFNGATDFTLNDTATGGAELREVGYPASIGGMSNYVDIGPLQHEDAGGGGGGDTNYYGAPRGRTIHGAGAI